MRTCLGCGRRAAQAELVRLTVTNAGEARVDAGRKAAGRGAYLCGPGCLVAAARKKSLGRAFRGRWKGGGLEQVEKALSEKVQKGNG